jgi:hypothetical protein
MHPTVTDRGVRWGVTLPTGEDALFYYNEIRRERTGVHALVAISLNDGETETILAHDTFNIGRQAERIRLANQAHKQLGEVHRESWALADMQHDLDTTALATPRLWEEERIAVVEYDPAVEPEEIRFAVEPFIIDGGGTIFFGPPGGGKSYLLQSIAVSVAGGHSSLWPVSAAPVLYINLERDGRSIHRRERAVMQALGIGLSRPSGVSYLHARGMGLSTVERLAKKWLRDHDGFGGVELDSVSRGGLGKLNEDETANRFIDVMNGLDATWWAAIGHTPRGDDTHLYGSVHFDAGEDIGVQVKSDRQGGTLGMSLRITKGNDIGNFGAQYLALEFDERDRPVSRIRHASATEFDALTVQKPQTEEDRIALAINETANGELSVGEIVERTGMKYPSVSRKLHGSERFALSRKEGRYSIYRLSHVEDV